MTGLLVVVGAVLSVAQLVLLARVVIDWVVVLSPAPGHTGVLRMASGLRRVSDPVLAPLRRVFPPVRVGSVTVDTSVPVAFLLLVLLRAVLGV